MTAVIAIDNLSFSYPDGQQALRSVSLNINRGDSVAIIGPNGAGKSTLVLHLNGILRSQNGAVKVFGRPVNEENLRWVRSRVGLVFQDPDDQLFSPTVFDDVAFGPINMGWSEKEVRQAVAKALKWVGLTGYGKRSSHHLSLGEKKRAAIATVLSMSPELLVLDEPTSNLDPGAKWSLMKLLKSLPVTRLIISHDLGMVKELCDRSIVFNKGSIIADGATKEILGNHQLLADNGLASQS